MSKENAAMKNMKKQKMSQSLAFRKQLTHASRYHSLLRDDHIIFPCTSRNFVDHQPVVDNDDLNLFPIR